MDPTLNVMELFQPVLNSILNGQGSGTLTVLSLLANVVLFRALMKSQNDRIADTKENVTALAKVSSSIDQIGDLVRMMIGKGQ